MEPCATLEEAVKSGTPAVICYVHCHLVAAGRDGKKLLTLIGELADHLPEEEPEDMVEEGA